MAALSSMLVGNTIQQMAYIISLTMLGMGIGGFLSKFVNDDARKEINAFVRTEVVLTLIAGTSAIQAYAASLTDFYVILIGLSYGTMSALVGFEDALLIRIMNRRMAHLGDAIGYTYLLNNAGGALVGLLYPLVFLPLWGMTGTAYAFGLFDGVVTLGLIWYFRREIGGFRFILPAHLVGCVLLIGLAVSNDYVPLVFEQSEYRVSVTQTYRNQFGVKQILQDRDDNVWLYINNQAQFSSRDERIYHELHARPALALAASRNPGRTVSVLIVGGGDALLVRETVKAPQVGAITLVDLDPQMTGEIAREQPVVAINESALDDPRVTIINADGYGWVKEATGTYDVILVDLPDPETPDLARLYTIEYYRAIAARLNPGGVFVTQATSPYMAPDAYWSIGNTIAEVFPTVYPYQAAIPSLRVWGWHMASNVPFDGVEIAIDTTNTKWLTQEAWIAAGVFAKTATDGRTVEEIRRSAGVSTLRDPRVMFYYQGVNWNN
jgi:spermidine synthase